MMDAMAFDRSTWASRRPFGLGLQRPNNYKELWKAVADNRDELGYAWRILRRGVCDGCALGTTGMRDWTMDEVHLCNIRLRLLRLNTMGPLDPQVLADVSPLQRARNDDLRDLGRLPYPMRRRAGDAGFTRISWDDALEEIAERIRISGPDRLGVYLTSRGMPNESYYAAQKATRAMGTNNIDNAARVCHSPSTYGLKEALGVGATTCSYTDWIGSDLVVFFGSNVATNQPVAMKYLYHAKKAGTSVVSVNTYREPGMERYWVPSNVESAVFGTRVTDRFFLVTVGGDLAFVNGTLKHIVERGWYDRAFVDHHTEGFGAMAAALAAQEWDDLERASGSTRHEMLDFARMVHEATTAVFVWSMGITQHAVAEDTVRALINLGLTGGFVGRDKCGLMPIRGHSGVQGGAEMGAYATALPGAVPVDDDHAARFSRLWGFDVPTGAGLTAPQMIDAAAAGRLDVLVSCGGNFREVLPDPAFVEAALARIPLRVHMDIVLTNQMLVDPPAGEEEAAVILLPATTRYEIAGGVTETSTERRVMFSPEIPGRRIGEARPEFDVLLDLARRVRPDLVDRLAPTTTAALREEIAAAVPFYDGIQRLREQGDQFQYGGPHLCAGWAFPTPDGKAHFSVVPLPSTPAVPEGMFRVATRRGKQFNSMIHEQRDGITGAGRDAIFIAPGDADRLGIADGDAVRLTSATGALEGRAFVAPVTPGTLQVHWPEGQVLIDRTCRSPAAGVPDYNALVAVARV